MTGDEIAEVMCVLLVAGLGTAQFVAPHLWTYRLTDDAVEYWLFGRFRLWRANFVDIVAVETMPFYYLIFVLPLRLSNRPFFARCVLLRLSAGRFRRVVLTPFQPEAFAVSLRDRMAGLAGRDDGMLQARGHQGG